MADGTVRLTEALLRLGKNLDLRFRIKLRNNVYFAPLLNDVARFFVCLVGWLFLVLVILVCVKRYLTWF